MGVGEGVERKSARCEKVATEVAVATEREMRVRLGGWVRGCEDERWRWGIVWIEEGEGVKNG